MYVCLVNLKSFSTAAAAAVSDAVSFSCMLYLLPFARKLNPWQAVSLRLFLFHFISFSSSCYMMNKKICDVIDKRQ